MKYYTLSFITILFLTSSCHKEMNKNNDTASSVSEKKLASSLDTIANCKWVFTEYHDKVTYQSGTNSMSIISDGNETAQIDMNGKVFLNRDVDFSFASIDYFNSTSHNFSFVSTSYAGPYYDTANYNVVNKTIIIQNHVKYLPDTMSIIIADTACLVLSGVLHTNGYNVNRTIIFYKNTRWYGGYRNYSGL
jgi:hypothetical protein